MHWFKKKPIHGAERDEIRLGIALWDDGSATAKTVPPATTFCPNRAFPALAQDQGGVEANQDLQVKSR